FQGLFFEIGRAVADRTENQTRSDFDRCPGRSRGAQLCSGQQRFQRRAIQDDLVRYVSDPGRQNRRTLGFRDEALGAKRENGVVRNGATGTGKRGPPPHATMTAPESMIPVSTGGRSPFSRPPLSREGAAPYFP